MEAIKQEMARVNINSLGISELKWTGMGELNSDDYYIYYCGQESLRRNGVAIIVNKRVHLFGVLVLKGLFGLRVIIQLQLLQCYRLGHRLGLLWY